MITGSYAQIDRTPSSGARRRTIPGSRTRSETSAASTAGFAQGIEFQSRVTLGSVHPRDNSGSSSPRARRLETSMVEIEARPRSPRQSRAATTSSSRPAIFRSQWTATLSSGASVNASRTASSVSGSRRAASPQSWATRSGGAPSGAGPATARRQSPFANSERGRSTSSSIISAPAATAASKLSRVLPGRIASAPLWPIRFKARHHMWPQMSTSRQFEIEPGSRLPVG